MTLQSKNGAVRRGLRPPPLPMFTSLAILRSNLSRWAAAVHEVSMTQSMELLRLYKDPLNTCAAFADADGGYRETCRQLS